MKLFIIRHGDPNYALDTLTERGWREAELLRDRLMRENITKVYLSPLGRAQDTAKPFLYSSGLTAETKDWLREFPRPAFQPLKKYGLGESDSNCCPWDLDLRLFTMFSSQLSDNEHWAEHEIYTTTGAADYALMVGREMDKLLAENGLERRGYDYVPNESFDEEQNIAVFLPHGTRLASDGTHRTYRAAAVLADDTRNAHLGQHCYVRQNPLQHKRKPRVPVEDIHDRRHHTS